MAKYNNSELCLIWLDSFIGLEYKHKKELYKLINGKDGIKEVLVKGKDYIINSVGENQYANLLNSANPSYLSYITEGLDRREINAVTIDSDSYSTLLKETPFAPLVLYAKGDVELLNAKSFAIVGSRKSLPASLKFTEETAKALVKAGLTLVTGIAEGVDKTVISSALDNNGKVISVLGGGFDTIYPTAHTELVDRITKTGLVISEYPPEVKAMPYHFPIRNRIIAGLCQGSLIVSGGLKSGTQHTANYAVEYGRDLFAVPYSVGVPSGAGCNELIKRGATLCDQPSDILSLYGLKITEQAKPLNDDELKIIKALSNGQQHVQEISVAVGKPVQELLPLISVLEIKGVVNKNGVNVYGLTKNVLEE